MSMMIRIRDMELPVNLGVYDWEKTQQRTIILHLDITLDMAGGMRAATSDDLADTLDYAVLETTLAALVQAKHYQLLEHLCATIANHVLEHPLANAVTVEISKAGALQNAPAVAMVHTASKS